MASYWPLDARTGDVDASRYLPTLTAVRRLYGAEDTLVLERIREYVIVRYYKIAAYIVWCWHS